LIPYGASLYFRSVFFILYFMVMFHLSNPMIQI
jgi:hypothetical protein